MLLFGVNTVWGYVIVGAQQNVNIQAANGIKGLLNISECKGSQVSITDMHNQCNTLQGQSVPPASTIARSLHVSIFGVNLPQ